MIGTKTGATLGDTNAGFPNVFINGRFLSRPPSGVDRVAEELVRAMEKILQREHSGDGNLTLAVPSKAKIHPQGMLAEELKNGESAFRVQSIGFLKGHFWEQFELGRYRTKDWLLNLCNTGPAARKNQFTFIHDAQIYLMPKSYSPVFRTVYRWLLPRLARNSNIIATVSEFSKSRLEKAGVFPVGKAVVVPNGSDHMDRIVPSEDMLNRFKLEKQGYILAIGSLAPHKNLNFLIEAVKARHCSEDIDLPPLVIAGGGNSKIFSDAGIVESSNIRVLGRVSDADLKSLYTHAITLAFPSLTEGFGLPPVEAMRCGCPVIASTGGAIPEVCGDAAMLIDPSNLEKWTAALERITDDPSLRKQLSEKGRIRAKEFTWSNAAQKVLNALRLHDSPVNTDTHKNRFNELQSFNLQFLSKRQSKGNIKL